MACDMGPEILIFKDAGALAKALAAHVLRIAAEAVAARGRFTIALPGGSAMALLAEGMRSAGSATSVDWSAWHVFWTDERCVPRGGADRNDAAVQRGWLAHVPIPGGQIHAMDDRLGPTDAARAYASRLAGFFRLASGEWPRFDLILLGAGADGHMASLFPGHPALDETELWVVQVFNAPKPPPERITLTLPVINHARHVAFAVAGTDKSPVLARLRNRASTTPSLPVQRVHLPDGEVRWFVDQAAANSVNNRGIP